MTRSIYTEPSLVSSHFRLTLLFMVKLRQATFKQYCFYTVIFLFGFVYQPTWVSDNFWFKADFYDSLPFQFPYFLYLGIYSAISVALTFQIIKLVKKHL